jgi:hypothetical protein
MRNALVTVGLSSEDELRQRLRRGKFRAAKIYVGAAAVGAISLAGIMSFRLFEDFRPEPSQHLSAASDRAPPATEPLWRDPAPPAPVGKQANAVAPLELGPEATSAAGSDTTELRPVADANSGEKPQTRSRPSRAEAGALLIRARDQIRNGNIAAARYLLERVADSDDQALLVLAETYDPEVLAQWGAVGIKANPELARALYKKAAQNGVSSGRWQIDLFHLLLDHGYRFGHAGAPVAPA